MKKQKRKKLSSHKKSKHLDTIQKKWFGIVSIVLLLLLGIIFFQYHNKNQVLGTNSTTFPDTTNNIHLSLTENYNVAKPYTSESGVIDYVWGASYPQPTTVYNTKYIKFDRSNLAVSPDTTVYNLSWFQTNHPDWIVYQCDKKTPAWEFGDTNYVPLDITNSQVLNFILQTYILPSLKQGYNGIAFDNVSLYNDANEYTSSIKRCGIYKNGSWKYLYSGSSPSNLNGSIYINSILNWAKFMKTAIKSAYPTATLSFNYGYDLLNYSGINEYKILLPYADLVFDEDGFTHFGQKGKNYTTDSQWKLKISAIQSVTSLGKGYVLNEYEPETNSQISRAEVQWNLANYLLVKSNHMYTYILNPNSLGTMYLRPEYDAQVGTPKGTMYFYQGVYWRDYTTGRALVNPSSTKGYTVSFTTTVYKDLYGNTITKPVYLPPHSGLVLVYKTVAKTNPTPTPPSGCYYTARCLGIANKPCTYILVCPTKIPNQTTNAPAPSIGFSSGSSSQMGTSYSR